MYLCLIHINKWLDNYIKILTKMPMDQDSVKGEINVRIPYLFEPPFCLIKAYKYNEKVCKNKYVKRLKRTGV